MLSSEKFFDALVAMVATGTTRPGEFATAPADVSTPYFILYHISGLPSGGDWSDVNDEIDWMVQFSCVGITPKQANFMADKVQAVMTAKTVNGPSNLLSEFHEQWRVVRELGAILPSGESLYQRADTYIIRTGGS